MKRKRSRYRLPDWLPTKHAKLSRFAKKSVFLICFLSKYFLIYPRLKFGRGLSPRFAQTAGDFFGVAAAVEG